MDRSDPLTPLALNPQGLLRQLATPLLTLPLLLTATAVQAAPATQSEMGLYTRIAAVNVCIARSAGIDFDKAVGVAGETIAQLIQGQRQGMIQQVGSKALSIEQLRRGAVNSAVLGAAEICPKSVPPDVMKKVEAALKQAGSKPAPK
ncbi:MAG: cAMP phosphodiesterase [Cyanobacteriota bacterium]|nr:cAMP phosphodiesterase [Cyanobacteriota bacterium]